ncbi:hypothetical protein SERLA73DRAFT_184782 [Serpula lacrymans var. lacrymans S7.3]|uniref:RING-type domain-containing protein n=2 Tax=Serpula lacrymans var. lacrymans TaxID=341189 RepID=F8Q542_SERL3|nr:hypothetical protein SERLA73DRAFT_184782 [Serpula lacrymans var. lacrymans S7.3]
MACPYSLNPRLCGHTFCAMCILKWFFSHLHRSCGAWHDSVDCPMCRCTLYPTPDDVPRPEYTFPFTPNRTVDCVIKNMLTNLGRDVEAKQNFAIWATDWKSGGNARKDWERKDRDGRDLMNRLTDRWMDMKSHEFIAIKVELEV